MDTSYKWEYLKQHEKVCQHSKIQKQSICCKREKKSKKQKIQTPKMEPNHETKRGPIKTTVRYTVLYCT